MEKYTDFEKTYLAYLGEVISMNVCDWVQLDLLWGDCLALAEVYDRHNFGCLL